MREFEFVGGYSIWKQLRLPQILSKLSNLMITDSITVYDNQRCLEIANPGPYKYPPAQRETWEHKF